MSFEESIARHCGDYRDEDFPEAKDFEKRLQDAASMGPEYAESVRRYRKGDKKPVAGNVAQGLLPSERLGVPPTCPDADFKIALLEEENAEKIKARSKAQARRSEINDRLARLDRIGDPKNERPALRAAVLRLTAIIYAR